MLLLASGCSSALSPGASPGANPPGASTAADAQVPDVLTTARAYLQDWKANDFTGMYALLTTVSQDAINIDEFSKHYRGINVEAALDGVDTEVLSALANENHAQVSYRVVLHSSLVGDITANTLMNLTLEGSQWRIQWDDTLVLPDLKGGNYLKMERSGYTPSRANIYDRQGHALVAQADATAIGLVPDQIDPGQADNLYTALGALTGKRGETIRTLVANAPGQPGWYLPLGEYPANLVANQDPQLSTFSGVELHSYKARYYFDAGIAPHVLGYVGLIQPDEVEDYERKGYRIDEMVGRSGLEKWGEQYLAGQRGGALFVRDAVGQPVRRLAEAPARPAQAIYTTLERDFQQAVQQAMGSFRGAAVVLERDTGRVLALVSSPAFDPNAFEPINYNSDVLLAELNNPDQPLLNRATQGLYPAGSIFKVVTMAAALESGLYTPETTYLCGYTFTELPGLTRYDWTYDYFQQDGKTQPSGLLTLPQGLMRSCNPFFWHIGLDLYNQDMTKAVSNMARSFGLGSATGIEGLDEAAGQVPDPINQADALNLAIGQGDLLVTPMQIADYIAAVGNGGTLYKPQVIENIAPPDGPPTYTFKPQVRGKLPLKPETLAAIQDGMRGVVSSTKPRGTAYHIFTGLDIPVAGKTGTATSGLGLPHAWFAGYTFAGQADKPDIAVAVIVENIGEGSVFAAPIFRRIVELYFYGSPGRLYDWESTYNVESTPTPEDQATPNP